MIGSWVVALAWAQEAPMPVAPIINADRVIVTTFQAEDPNAQPAADRLFGLLADRLARSNDLVRMSDVPKFEPQGYGGDVYMHGCPPGKYAGCALVLGQRVNADRAVGCSVKTDPDSTDPTRVSVVLTVHLVDVAEAQEVASFGIPVAPDREADAIEGIAKLFDEVVHGDYERRDLRPEGPTPDEIALAKDRKDQLAASLAELEQQLGTAVRSDDVGSLQPPHMSRADLASFVNHDEAPPWERVHMSQGQYLRYVNSGQDLHTWRTEGNGRFGKIVFRASAGGGGGPWSESYEGKVLLSDQNLQPVDSVQYVEVINHGSAVGDLELGFGVAPWVDLTFAADVRNGTTAYSLDEDVQNQISLPTRPTSYTMSSWSEGVRATFAPFPRWPARPTAAAGLAFWSGAGIPSSNRFPRLGAPKATLFEVLPGVEADATPILALTLRGLVSIPLVTDYVHQSHDGDPLLEHPPTPSGDRGIGIAVQAGLTFRIGPVWGDRTRTTGPTFDEENEL